MQADNAIVSTDVLVIGAGSAGLRAAIEAARKGAKVVIANKAPFPGGSTSISGGYMQASFGWLPEDTKDNHFKDTIISGKYLCDQKLVRILVEEAADRIFDLEDWGVLITRVKPTRYEQVLGGGLTVPRRVMVGGRNDDVQRILYETALGYGVKMYDQVMATGLITDGDRNVVGATAIDVAGGSFIIFRTKATILANGPCGGLFKISTNTRSSTGDGFAMAFNSGAKLVNMEFMLFVPLGFIYPDFMRGVVLGELSSWGRNSMALNALGERFMKKYAPKTMEMSTRDISARASYTEIMEGRGTPLGGILIDNSKNDLSASAYGPVRGPAWYRMVKECLGEDVANLRKPLEAAPSALFCLGGVKINERCETSLRGLYASGEVESNIHGANRLAGNALIEMQVFGARAGHYAADYAAEIPLPEVVEERVEDERKRIFAFFNHKEGFRPVQIKKEIQDIMWSKVGIVRNGEELREAIRKIEALRRDKLPQIYITSATRRYNYEWIEAIEVGNMAIVAEMMGRCALMREESRGAHYRKDFPKMDNENWLKESVVTNLNGKIQLDTGPVNITEMPPGKEEAYD